MNNLYILFYYSRLVRQDHVKEDLIRTNTESRSPIKKTFAEAKQNLMEYNNQQQGGYDDSDSFAYCDNPPFREYNNDLNQRYDEEEENMYDRENYESNRRQLLQYDEMNKQTNIKPMVVRSTEQFLNDSSPEYFHPEEYIRSVRKDRTRRRRSKDFIEPEVIISSNDDEPIKRKPETMRSVSEDTGTKIEKSVPRRSMSHPENNVSKSVICLSNKIFIRIN